MKTSKTGKTDARKPKAKKQRQQGKDRFSKRQRAVESEDMRSESRVTPDARSDSDYHTGTPNDWRWYALNAQLVKDYASFPFGYPIGLRKQTGLASVDNYATPGIMALYFEPTIGVANSETDPINVAMRRLYSFVRHANSGASNYEAPDLMLYLLAVDSCLMYLSYLKRIYGVAMDYSAMNRYYPDALLRAMQVDPDNLRANLNDFRGYINQYAVRIAQLWIPNTMSYMARHSWMCEAIYTDSANSKAQTYMYVPTSYFQYVPASGNDAGALKRVYVSGASSSWSYANRATVADLITFGNSLLAPIIGDEDIGIMSGDILKAFGESGIVKVSGITEGYQILPVYDQEVLSQMENATILPTPLYTTDGVTQDTAIGGGFLKSTVRCSPNITLTVAPPSAQRTNVLDRIIEPYTLNKMINFHHMNVSPEEIMVATRLSVSCSLDDATIIPGTSATIQGTLTLPYAGSEVVTGAAMWYYNYAQATPTLDYSSFATAFDCSIRFDTGSHIGQDGAAVLRRMANLSAFDWHPIVVPFGLYSGADASSWSFPQSQGVLGDLDNYTYLSSDNLKSLHTTALLSEFSVPMLG